MKPTVWKRAHIVLFSFLLACGAADYAVMRMALPEPLMLFWWLAVGFAIGTLSAAAFITWMESDA